MYYNQLRICKTSTDHLQNPEGLIRRFMAIWRLKYAKNCSSTYLIANQTCIFYVFLP